MSEIERYEPERVIEVGTHAVTAMSPHERGAWVRYADLLWYQRQYWMSLIINVVVVLVCGVLAALLVQEKAARSPAEVPIGAGEKLGLLHEMEAMKKSRDDYKAMALNYKAQIKVLNARVDGHVDQLEALQARGLELDRLSREQAQRMSTNQGVVMEAKRVLGVNVRMVEP